MTKSRELGNLPQLIPASIGSASQTLAVNAAETALEYVDAASGGGGGSMTAVASGALANGDTIIVNSDGTVSAVTGSTTTTVGSATEFHDAIAGTYLTAAYDEQNDKVVICYKDKDNSDYGTGIVGSISGSSISFGTPAVFMSQNVKPNRQIKLLYIPASQKVLILHANNGTYLNLFFGTVSGTSISFNTTFQQPFGGVTSEGCDMCYDSGSGKVIIANSTNYMKFQVATISGSSISFGTAYQANTWANYGVGIQVRSNGSGGIFCTFQAGADSYKPYGIALSLSGTTLTGANATEIWDQGQYAGASMCYVPSISRFLIVLDRVGYKGFLISISGTSWTKEVGPVSMPDSHAGGTYKPMAIYHTAAAAPFVIYNHGTNNYIRKLTVSSNSISYGSATDLGAGYWPEATYDPDTEQFVYIYNSLSSGTSSASGNVKMINPNSITSNLTSENYIGISDAAYSNGATATIQVAGAVDDAQSGLTSGQSYFVQGDGSLGLTAANPSVFAGTAVSATKIIVKG